MKQKGLGTLDMVLLLGLIALLVLVSGIPNFVNSRQKGYDRVAKNEGRNAKLAEEVYYNDRETVEGSYTSDMNLLLQIDHNLTDDPGVTFVFYHASASGFTLHTEHVAGTGIHFLYHD